MNGFLEKEYRVAIQLSKTMTERQLNQIVKILHQNELYGVWKDSSDK